MSTSARPDGTATVASVQSVTQAQTIGTPVAPGLAASFAMAGNNAAAVVARAPAFLQASPHDAFVQGNVVSSSGLFYVPYERTYAGIPVVGGDFVMVIDGVGRNIYNSAALDHPIGLASITPTLSQADAETIAIRQLRSLTRVEGTQLVVNALGPAPRLAWESTVDGFGANGISRLTVDVDAFDGSVLRQQEHVMYGTGTSAWNGPNPVTLNTTSSGGTFSMRDPTVTNLSCQDAANNQTFTGPDDVWGNGDATLRETGCVDALFGAQTEARMLSQWLGRNAMDGAGGAWPIRVGLQDLNAFYDGTEVQIGHNVFNQWIGSIDVIAHENGHGVDDHTPGGISGNGTQEFIADTFGASTEWFANEPAPFDVPDFTVGEQINLLGSGPIRNMFNPSALGDPNCYSDAIPSTEVHSAAGPGNHWFYLLAEGSNPTNGQPVSPTCNGSTVVGIGVQNAITILYNAMLIKTTESSYLRYRTWTLQAAKNLFPTSCDNFNAVKAAWDAVSVPPQTDEPGCTASGGCVSGTFSATGLPMAIPDNNPTGITSNLAVIGTGTVGSLSLSLNITHPFRGDLVVTLIAPDNVPFVVSNRAGGPADNLVITNQAIIAFNGHVAAGTWRLKVQDLAGQDVGTLNSWSLSVVGSCSTGVSWSGSATPNLATIDNGTACTSLTVGPAPGSDSLQAKLSISGRHDFCSILRGTLAHNGITVTAFPTGTFPAAACNFSFTDRAVPGVSGDASGTWTLCIVDTDPFGDTGTLDTWSVHN